MMSRAKWPNRMSRNDSVSVAARKRGGAYQFDLLPAIRYLVRTTLHHAAGISAALLAAGRQRTESDQASRRNTAGIAQVSSYGTGWRRRGNASRTGRLRG